MAEVLNSVLGILVRPKKVIEVDESALHYLTGDTVHILFAVAEAVLGENFLERVPNFIATIDDYLAYQRRSQREALMQALLIAETPAFNFLVGRKLRGFSHMSIDERRDILDKLRDSDRQLRRNIYAAFVNISASTYYASPSVWPDIQYAGVSVDHPGILTNRPPIPWRPTDPRPIEK